MDEVKDIFDKLELTLESEAFYYSDKLDDILSMSEDFIDSNLEQFISIYFLLGLGAFKIDVTEE